MSYKTQRHIKFFKDICKGVFSEFKGMPSHGGRVITSDAVWTKGKYRKRAAQPRQRVEKVIIYRESLPRVARVKRIKK